MPSGTISALQKLKDAEFHALGDELLPRISPRYFPVVPHGRNESGDSIRGQPDSYVGDDAASCSVAIQYSVQQRAWWTKAIEDITEARNACPKAVEIVIVLPRDLDREKPAKGAGRNWHDEAKKAAAPARLTVIGGRALSEQLDTTCQDLRSFHLGIPFSRISWHALVAGSREASAEAVHRLKSFGRYDPTHYVEREADARLFELWQDSLRAASGHSPCSRHETLIPLVSDSGIGKTSLLAHFVERVSSHAPVLLLLARAISFDRDDILKIRVIDQLQGSMDASLRSSEESQVLGLLAGKIPLTVVLDGLDETTNAVGVRRAIDSWIASKFGKACVLVVSSRPEFWRKCSESTWTGSTLRDNKRPSAARSLRYDRDLATLDPRRGVELPGEFTGHELSKAWVQGGRPESEFWQLPQDVRRVLAHPFTLKSALDLLAGGTSPSQLQTRSAILAAWIDARLKAEADPGARITKEQYRECLLVVARTVSKREGSWVPVDELKEVPRFDSSDPPGVVVERLIAANIFETHLEHHDQIRFSFEAIQDFFLAESMLDDIENDPKSAADSIAELPFSEVVGRLERIGERVSTKSIREAFVEALSGFDGLKAAVVLRTGADCYSPECRATVVSRIAPMLDSPMHAEQALATEILARLRCPESRDALEAHWTANAVGRRLHATVSRAAMSHGLVSLVPHVFGTRWFTDERYFVDLRPELLATTVEFREALAKYALQFVPSDGDSDDYHRALSTLAYLKDERGVDPVRERTNNSMPLAYESQYLLAIGSREALDVYSTLVDRFVEAKNAGLDHESEKHWDYGVIPWAGVANLVTSEVEEFVCGQIDSTETVRRGIGRSLAQRLGTGRLIGHMVRHWGADDCTHLRTRGLGNRLGSEAWIELWNQIAEAGERKALAVIAGDLRDPRVEGLLIKSLVVPKIGGYCAGSLAEMGSQQACAAMRHLLASGGRTDESWDWDRHMAFIALCVLRDPASVEDLVRYLRSEEGSRIPEGAIGLASVGTQEAEIALLGLREQSDASLVEALVHFGSDTCIKRAIEIAKAREGAGAAAAWLAEQCAVVSV
ncbi:MAG: NACHT domain-containing protein [Candidatus Eisenbacteria bacterium]